MERKDALSILGALAHETRLDAFRLLVRAGPAGLSAGVVGERLKIPRATLSFHLKELKNAGVVRCRRESRSLIYSPDFAAMNALLEFLTEHCCEGSPCAPSREPAREKT